MTDWEASVLFAQLGLDWRIRHKKDGQDWVQTRGAHHLWYRDRISYLDLLRLPASEETLLLMRSLTGIELVS